MEFHLPSGLLKCPPLLDSSYFLQWKNCTKNLIGIEHPQLWEIIEKGPLEITKQNRDEWDDEDYDKCRKNARALHILYCALSSNDCYRVATCKTAKQVWDDLTLAYEGADYQSVLLASEFRKASLQETGLEPGKMEPGSSTLGSPMLDDEGSPFQQWKARVRAYIESTDPQLWHIIESGEFKATKLDENGLEVEKSVKELDQNDYTKLSKNARAKMAIYYGLPKQVFNIMMCDMKTAKILWKALNDRYEGSEDFKQVKISSLERELELFEMIEGESIKEMFNRLVTIIGKLALLGEQVSMPAQVRKIMRSLPYNDEYMDKNDYTKPSKSTRAKMAIYLGLPKQVFNEMICSMETAKILWKALNDRYEGGESLKQMRITSLERDLELFKMSKGESIKEMFDRFVAIIGKLALLGEQVSMPAQVRKIMRSLPFNDEYTVFIMNTEFSKDWAKMSLNELFAKLLAYEERHGLRKSRRNR